MPYIDSSQRNLLELTGAFAGSAGQLNYQITLLIRKYVELNSPMDYQILNDVLGALEGAKLEFVRRVVNPYEDSKIAQNGDVYND